MGLYTQFNLERIHWFLTFGAIWSEKATPYVSYARQPSTLFLFCETLSLLHSLLSLDSLTGTHFVRLLTSFASSRRKSLLDRLPVDHIPNGLEVLSLAVLILEAMTH
jgi:hypothetical protein